MSALQPAYLLQSRPYGDSSQLLELFTRDLGRVGAVARGSRGPRSRLRGALQPFTPLLVGLGGRGELQTLTTAETAGPTPPLTGEQVFYGWYVQELLLRLTHRDDPHPSLYALLPPTFQALAGPLHETALRQFEYRLLTELGFGLPPLPSSLQGAARLDWQPDAGWRADPRGPLQPASLAELFGGQPLSVVAARELRLVLGRALQLALGGRTLETPRLLRAMRARAGR